MCTLSFVNIHSAIFPWTPLRTWAGALEYGLLLPCSSQVSKWGVYFSLCSDSFPWKGLDLNSFVCWDGGDGPISGFSFPVCVNWECLHYVCVPEGRLLLAAHWGVFSIFFLMTEEKIGFVQIFVFLYVSPLGCSHGSFLTLIFWKLMRVC